MTSWMPPEPAPEPAPPAAGWTAPPSPSAPPQWAYAWNAPPRSPQPGIIPLRPLGVGELLDGAFTTIRRYPRATLGFAAIVMLAVETVQVISSYVLLNGIPSPSTAGGLSDTQFGDYAARAGTAGIASVLVTGLAVLLLTGMVTIVVGEGALGRPVEAGDAWARLRPLFGRLVGVSLLTFLIVTGVLVGGVIPGVIVLAAGARGPGAFLLVVGLLGAGVASVWIWVSLSLAPAVVVLERQGVRAALRRSRLLVRRSWWRVFWILVLAAIISFVVSGIISLPFNLAGGGLGGLFSGRSTSLGFGQLLVTGIGGLVAGTIVRPFTAGVTALLYIDRRMRAEGLDVTLTQAATGTTAA